MFSTVFKIIIASLKISLFSFGGGAAVISLIQKEYIEKNNFMDEEDFKKLVILANAMPGPTILQLTTVIAYRAASYFGAILNYLIILFLGPILLVLLLGILKPYIDPKTLHKLALSMIPAVVGMLFAFTWSVFKQDKAIKYNWNIYYLILLLVFILLILQVNIIFIFISLIILLLVFKIK